MQEDRIESSCDRKCVAIIPPRVWHPIHPYSVLDLFPHFSKIHPLVDS